MPSSGSRLPDMDPVTAVPFLFGCGLFGGLTVLAGVRCSANPNVAIVHRHNGFDAGWTAAVINRS